MKTAKNLFCKIITFENILIASRKARKGKRNKNAASLFEENLENELLLLQDQLTNKTYQPGQYRSFYIFEPKKRLISAAPYRDRVVHHALCNIIGPVFDRSFIFDSYANRIGKGTYKAVLRYQHFARRYKYVLKANFRKYFPGIDHQLLKEKIRRKIGCKETLWLMDTIIDNSTAQEPVYEMYPGDDLFTSLLRRKGIPIGNLTSQFLANVYLNGFDHFMKEQKGTKYYLRYMDDFVVFANDKNFLKEMKLLIDGYLKSELKLHLKVKATILNQQQHGLSFLGARIYPGCLRIHPNTLKRSKNKLKLRKYEMDKQKIPEEKFVATLNSINAHLEFFSGKYFRNLIYQQAAV